VLPRPLAATVAWNSVHSQENRVERSSVWLADPVKASASLVLIAKEVY
jgi:hypothetical protein